MKHKQTLVTATIFALLLGSSPALATVVDLDIELDLQDSAYFGDFTPPLSGLTTQVWSSGLFSIPQFSLQPGDAIQINVSFAEGQSMTLINGEWGRQQITVAPAPGITCSSCSAETMLTDMSILGGSLSTALPISDTGVYVLGIPVASITTQLTDNSVTFDSFTLLAQHSSDVFSSPLSEISFLFQSDQILLTQVPVPGALGFQLFALGVLVIGTGHKARRNVDSRWWH